MIFSRSNYSESSPISSTQSLAEPARQHLDDSAPPPRWGLLVAAIVAAVVTASWVGSELPTSDADMAQAQSSQAQGK
jgi:hypothetical protein